jgi:hypothetical protein
MRRIHLALPLLLLALTACGGSGSGTAALPLEAGLARKATNDLMTFESLQATPTSLPIWAPTPEGSALGFTPGSMPACVSKGAPSAPDGNGYTHVVSTYTNCNGPHGGLLNGTVEVAFKNADYLITYNLTASAPGSTYTWTYTGQRHAVLDTTAKTSTLTSTIVVTTFNGGSSTGAETYTGTWNADWATVGTYKLWGSFQVTATGQETLTGTVAAASPLSWSAGCCYPGSGTLALVKGARSADITFALPCGKVFLALPGSTTATVSLPPC